MPYRDRIHVLNHKGKEIYYFDFSGLRADEHKWVMDIALEMALKSNQRDFLYISNVKNTRLSIEGKNKAKEVYAKLSGLGYSIRAATIGLTAWQRLIVSAIDRKMIFADDLETAMNKLVAED